MNTRDDVNFAGSVAAAPRSNGDAGAVRAPVRVAIFDDHEVMRQVLSRALSAEGSFEIVAAGASADEAVTCGQALLPDLIVTDLQMPGGGLEAVRRLFQTAPFVKIVVLSSDDSEHMVSACFSAGAFGFLTKGQPLRSMIASLAAVAAGQALFSAGVARTLVSNQGVASPWRGPGDATDLPITAREQQILSRYAQGLTVDEIAASIGVSERTVAAFMTNILHKLHEHTLLEKLLETQ